MLIAAPNQVESLRSTLPAAFRSVPIVPLTTNRLISRLISFLGSLIEFRLQRTPQKEAVRAGEKVELECIPAVTRISGIAVTPDDVLERAYVKVQYHSHHREFIEMQMSFTEAVRLHGYLNAAMKEPKLAPLVELAVKILHKLRSN